MPLNGVNPQRTDDMGSTTLTSLIVVLTVPSSLLSQLQAVRNVSAEGRLRTVVAMLTEHYVDSLDSDDLYDMAIDGMLASLNDPYTTLLRGDRLDGLLFRMTGNFAGIGMEIESLGRWIAVVHPLPRSPSARAGLKPGDRIIEVDNESTTGWTTQQVASATRGELGTRLKLTVLRPGVAEPLHIEATRDFVHVGGVDEPINIAPGIGYIRVRSFTQGATDEVRAAVERLEARGARGLILDLRDNPGGSHYEAVGIADLFLDSAQTVVTMKGHGPGMPRTYKASHPQRWADMPLVVLLNEATASAAEVVAGALQDHDRALLVGTPSFGKGVSSFFRQLSDSHAVRITIARLYTPSGRSISRIDHRHQSKLTTGLQLTGRGDWPSATTVYVSDAGRVLGGEGRIVPDIVVAADSAKSGDDLFVTVPDDEAQALREIIALYPFDVIAAGMVSHNNLEVTDVMIDKLLDRSRARGISVPIHLSRAARESVARQVHYQLTRYLLGRPAELRDRARDDVQVRCVIKLLRKARTLKELLAAGRAGG